MIVATSQQGILVDSTSPSGEKIVIWKTREGLYTVFHFFPALKETTIIEYGSVERMVEHLPNNTAWFFDGIKDDEIIKEVQKQIK